MSNGQVKKMPRKKDYFEYIDDMGTNLIKALEEQRQLKSEFIEEFQQAPMVRFYVITAAPAVQNWIVLFMKHFAFTILYYEDNTNLNLLPARPNYDLLAAGDVQKWFFWRQTTEIPNRSFELQDMNYEIRGTSVWNSELEDYINKVYLDRKTNTWMGLSAICAAWGWTPEEFIGSPNNLVHYDDLISNPDEECRWNVDDLYKFWLQMKKRFEGWESEAWQLQLSPPKDNEIPQLEEIENQSQLDAVAIDEQVKNAIIMLQNNGLFVNYTIEELIKDYKILKDYKYKMDSQRPFALQDWEQFPTFHMEFYQGNSYFIPTNYSIDENATIVYNKTFNDDQNLIIRRAVRNTYQTNATNALNVAESLLTAAVSMGFYSVTGAMCAKYVYQPTKMTGGWLTAQTSLKTVVPRMKGVSVIGGILGSSAISNLVDFGIEGSDRTWYIYPMYLSASYGKFVDYKYQKPTLGEFKGKHPFTGAGQGERKYTELSGKLWDQMLELDVDQNKYAYIGNQFFTGKIKIDLYPGKLPFTKKDILEAYEWMNIAAVLEIALKNKTWEVRGYDSTQQILPGKGKISRYERMEGL